MKRANPDYKNIIKVDKIIYCVLYQAIDEEELEDVKQHPPKRDLKRSKMRVGCEQGNEAQGTENVCYCKNGLCYECWVPHLPLVPGFAATVLNGM